MIDEPAITKLAFERPYHDNSGVEFGVSYEKGRGVTFERVHKVDFPIEELDWLIACLMKIRAASELGRDKGETR